MTDRYRISTATDVLPRTGDGAYGFGGPGGSGEPGGSGGSGGASGALLRRLLWVVLVVSVLGNSAASFVTASTLVNLGFGLVTASCVIALVAHHLRRSR